LMVAAPGSKPNEFMPLINDLECCQLKI